MWFVRSIGRASALMFTAMLAGVFARDQVWGASMFSEYEGIMASFAVLIVLSYMGWESDDTVAR